MYTQLNFCICEREWAQIIKYMEGGVCIGHLSEELKIWGLLQGLNSLKGKLEFFKVVPYNNFTREVKRGICEGEPEVEQMVSSVNDMLEQLNHMLDQLNNQIVHLEQSVDTDVVKSILAKHQAKPQPDFTDMQSLPKRDKVLSLVEHEKWRSEARDIITKTLIARKTWEGEGYLPRTLKCDTEMLCEHFWIITV